MGPSFKGGCPYLSEEFTATPNLVWSIPFLSLPASAEWVNMFTENPCNCWDGLCLSQPINIEKRQLIKKGRASLLDFRNYLFSRQCTLLFLMYRPAEVAQRSIPFMHNCIQELDSLEVGFM